MFKDEQMFLQEHLDYFSHRPKWRRISMLHPVTVAMATMFLQERMVGQLWHVHSNHSSTSQSVCHTSLKGKMCSRRNTALC